MNAGGLLDSFNGFLQPEPPGGAAYDKDTAARARAALLLGVGGNLLAAGQGGGPPGSRGQYLARLGEPVKESQQILAQGAQQALTSQQLEAARAQLAEKAKLDAFMSDPNNLAGLGVTPEQAKLFSAAPAGQAANALMNRALAAPKKEYRLLSPAEVKTMGLPPGAYQVGTDGKVSSVGGGGVNIFNGSNAGQKASIEMDQKYVEEARKRTAGRSSIVPQVRMMHDLNMSGDVQGGAVRAALLPARNFVAALGLMSEEQAKGLSDEQFYESLINYVVPSMRPEGSGHASDKDMAIFLRSLPALGMTRQGRMMTSAFMKQSLEWEAQRTEEMASYFRTNHSLEGFDEYAQAKLGAVIPVVENDDQFSALPVGTLYKGPGGKFSVKVQ